MNEKQIEMLRGSKQELAAGGNLTYENLRKFIDLELSGTTVGQLIEYFDCKLKEAIDESYRQGENAGILGIKGKIKPNITIVTS